MTIPAELAPVDRHAFDTLFECATHRSSSGDAARSLLLAWQRAERFGGFDFTKLWRFDFSNRHAAAVVFEFILSHSAVHPMDLPGYRERYEAIRDLHERLRADELARDGQSIA